MRVVVAVLLALVLVTPAEAATTKVTWPEAREYRPGERIAVTVKGDRRVKVAVLRVSSSGRVMRALTRRTLKRGTVRATLDRAGRYEVRVGTRQRTVTAVNPPPATTPPGDPALECAPATAVMLEATLSADRVQRGQNLPFAVRNIGDTCVLTGVGYGLEYHQGDGAWTAVPWPLASPAIALTLQRGATLPLSVHIPADAPLGTYRILGYSGFTEPTFDVVA